MDDFAAMKISQSIQDSFGHLAEHFLPCSTTKLLDFSVDTVKTAAFAILHRDGYSATGVVKGAIVFAYVLGSTFLVEG